MFNEVINEMVVYVPTLKDFKEVIEWAFEQGKMWRNGSTSIHEEYWSTYGSSTCIDIKNIELGYCTKAWAINYGKTITDMVGFRKYIRDYKVNEFGKKFDLR